MDIDSRVLLFLLLLLLLIIGLYIWMALDQAGVFGRGPSGLSGLSGLFGGTGPSGGSGLQGIAGGIQKWGEFFGLTAGTGMIGTDYAATIAVKTGAGTGRVPFPQNGPAAGIVRIDTSSFTLPDIGTYLVSFSVHTTEAGQLQLELNGVDLPQTVAENFNPTAGGHPIIGTAIITTVGVNAVLAVVNPTGNTPALTVTPANGSQTHANAQTLTIERIA